MPHCFAAMRRDDETRTGNRERGGKPTPGIEKGGCHVYAVHLCLDLVLEMLETLHRTPMTRTIRGVQKDAKVSGGIISFWILECIDGWCISDAARKDPQADAQKHRYPVSV